MSIKFLLLGGGYFGFWGGGSADFYFYGREDFSDSSQRKSRILGPQKIAIFPGAVKIAAATAENRAILVHSATDC